MCLDPEPSIEIYYNALPIILIINVWGVSSGQRVRGDLIINRQ